VAPVVVVVEPGADARPAEPGPHGVEPLARDVARELDLSVERPELGIELGLAVAATEQPLLVTREEAPRALFARWRSRRTAKRYMP